MRIGYDAKRYFNNTSGLGNYSRDLIRILEQYYPDNNYIKYTPSFSKTISLSEDLKTITKLPTGFLNQIAPSLWRNKYIIEDLKRDKIDLFHGLSGEIPLNLKKNKIKSIVTIHDLIFLKFPQLYKSIDRYIYNKKFIHAVNNADQVIAISKQTKHDIMEFYGLPSSKIQVIYQGCHPAFKKHKTTEEKKIIREKYNLPENFLLNVGSIEPRKNALQIIKAIENIDIPLIIIGKWTPYTDKIKSYIIEKKMEKRVFLMQGFTMDELSTIYAMADIFIYPSVYEGFGIPIIESLFSKTPVITTNSGVFPEAGGHSSYYIDPYNIEQLTDAITAILQDSDLRLKMINDGIQYVQQFNDIVIAKKWIKAYNNEL